MKSKKETDAWFRALEAERHDISWRLTQPAKQQPDVVYVQKKVDYRTRDRVMFHAGRYAEGARDADALRANLEVSKYIRKGI